MVSLAAVVSVYAVTARGLRDPWSTTRPRPLVGTLGARSGPAATERSPTRSPRHLRGILPRNESETGPNETRIGGCTGEAAPPADSLG